MIAQEDSVANLISWLLQLHEKHDKEHDSGARGRLANLRFALRDRLHADYPVGRVIPALTAGALSEDDERNEWYTVVAGLFGLAHDQVAHRPGVSLGAAARMMYDKRGNESLERRFMATVGADVEHLPGHLRQTISLLKSCNDPDTGVIGVGLDWRTLLLDVLGWSRPGKPVQKRWVRDYYKARRNEVDSETAPAGTTEGE